jgi:hypothetical protein
MYRPLLNRRALWCPHARDDLSVLGRSPTSGVGGASAMTRHERACLLRGRISFEAYVPLTGCRAAASCRCSTGLWSARWTHQSVACAVLLEDHSAADLVDFGHEPQARPPPCVDRASCHRSRRPMWPAESWEATQGERRHAQRRAARSDGSVGTQDRPDGGVSGCDEVSPCERHTTVIVEDAHCPSTHSRT